MKRTDVMIGFAKVLDEHFCGMITSGERASIIVELMEVHDAAVEEQIDAAFGRGQESMLPS